MKVKRVDEQASRWVIGGSQNPKRYVLIRLLRPRVSRYCHMRDFRMGTWEGFPEINMITKKWDD